MPFIIPNAVDTTSGNKYEALDQAEPDALDFEVLGARTTGVVSGCNVSSLAVPSSSAVRVEPGVVSLNGVVYSVVGSAALAVPQAPVDNRFDVVIARLISGNMTLTVCYGSDSALNPVFPRSANRMVSTAGFPVNSYINPDTDVVLAAIYRSGGNAITNARIVDKRTSLPTGILLRGGTAPATSLGANGDLYLKTNVDVKDSSGVYVKRNNAWQELAAAGADPGVPIGTVITWIASTNPNPDVWIECNGATLSKTGVHAELFNVLGTTYGEPTSTSFSLPDFRGQFLMGLPVGSRTLGVRYGNTSNQTSLTVANLPSHNHALNLNTGYNGDHEHDSKTGIDGRRRGFVLGSSRNVLNGPITSEYNEVEVQSRMQGAITFGLGRSNIAGGHTHMIIGNTASTGSGTAVNIEPSNFAVRYFIRYA